MFKRQQVSSSLPYFILLQQGGLQWFEPSAITLTSSITPEITDDLTLNGPGSNLLTISCNYSTPGISVGRAAVTLSGIRVADCVSGVGNSGTLTIINSIVTDNEIDGVNNVGTLAIINCTLSNNGRDGIYNSGTLAIDNSNLSNNKHSGIYNSSFSRMMTVTNSAVSNSLVGIFNDGKGTVVGSTVSGSGQGIDNRRMLTITNSTISDNSLAKVNAIGTVGGGVLNIGDLVVTNSTISGNSSNSNGGGIYSVDGTLIVTNSTISNNSATTSGGGIYGDYISAATLSNSIVAGNIATLGGPPLSEISIVRGVFTNQGYNLFGANGEPGVNGVILAISDRILSGPITTAIGPLANNGGPTLTHLPVAGSQAINAGNNALIPTGITTDQRGTGFPRIVGGTVDIGAVEADTVSPAQTLIDNYYRTILSRAPDAGGLAFWQDEVSRLRGLGVDVQEVFRVMAGWFFNSAEYLAKNTSDSQYVTDLYRTFFQRSPDSGGLGYWTGQLTQGMPRSVVLFSFLFSTEFGSYMQGLLGNTASRAEVYAVVDFYRGFLNRLADGGGFSYWIGRFRAAQCQGAAAVNAEVDSISTQYLGSGEYTGRNRSNRDYVADLYYAFLRRGGELTGFNFWVSQLNNGLKTREQLRQEFLKSPEFQGRVSQIIAQGCL